MLSAGQPHLPNRQERTGTPRHHPGQGLKFSIESMPKKVHTLQSADTEWEAKLFQAKTPEIMNGLAAAAQDAGRWQGGGGALPFSIPVYPVRPPPPSKAGTTQTRSHP